MRLQLKVLIEDALLTAENQSETTIIEKLTKALKLLEEPQLKIVDFAIYEHGKLVQVGSCEQDFFHNVVMGNFTGVYLSNDPRAITLVYSAHPSTLIYERVRR